MQVLVNNFLDDDKHLHETILIEKTCLFILRVIIL